MRSTRLGFFIAGVVSVGLLSGCVGNNTGKYFETTTKEIDENNQLQTQSQTTQNDEVQTTSIDPVVINTLPETQASTTSTNNSPTTINEQTTMRSFTNGGLTYEKSDGQQQASVSGYNFDQTNNFNSFAYGVESAPIDPIEAAAQQRIDPLYAIIDHGSCKSEFGPKPRNISAKRVNPGDPYYLEIRMRRTPLLPVGHTYVAYGRLGANGKPLDEKLIMLAPVGGYAGAALASGVPMPSILKPHRDDCRIRPKTAYRVSLNAQRYEKLLHEIIKAKSEKPKYLLFAYNCNHFMTRIAGSVGILPPKNIYVPAVEYLYAMIERNEGRKVSRW